VAGKLVGKCVLPAFGCLDVGKGNRAVMTFVTSNTSKNAR
jgi:hypothetical protein